MPNAIALLPSDTPPPGRTRAGLDGLEMNMNVARTIAVVVSLVPGACPADAQWLNHPTPDIPRTSDGKPNFAAPAPRGGDGHPDFSGVWTVTQTFPPLIGVPLEALTAESRRFFTSGKKTCSGIAPSFDVSRMGPKRYAAGGASSKRLL